MSQLASDFKESLFNSPPSPFFTPPNANLNRYMQHFESINSPQGSIQHQTHVYPSFANQQLFAAKIQEYSRGPSIVDRIINEDETVGEIFSRDYGRRIVRATVGGLKSGITQNIKRVQQFFYGQSKENGQVEAEQILEFDVFADLLGSLGKSRRIPEPPPIVQAPPVSAQIQTVPISQIPSLQPSQPPSTLRRADVLLFEILRLKKHKSFHSDYFGLMEIKLMELLEHILEGEERYIGMSGKQKMKQVLKQLETFKGKLIEGQSKINLLRIFFEEFKNLKQQRQLDSGHQKDHTPVKHLQKSNQNHLINKPKDDTVKKWTKKQTDTRSVNSQHTKNSQGKKSVGRNSVNQQKQDEWIGELN